MSVSNLRLFYATSYALPQQHLLETLQEQYLRVNSCTYCSPYYCTYHNKPMRTCDAMMMMMMTTTCHPNGLCHPRRQVHARGWQHASESDTLAFIFIPVYREANKQRCIFYYGQSRMSDSKCTKDGKYKNEVRWVFFLKQCVVGYSWS